MASKDKFYIDASEDIAKKLLAGADPLLRAKKLSDDMKSEVDTLRGTILDLETDIIEIAPPDTSSVYVERKDGEQSYIYRFTFQTTGGQARIDKTKLLHAGVDPDVIEECTVYSKQGRTVTVVREVINNEPE